MSPVDNTIFIQGDFSSADIQSKLLDQLRFRLNIPSTTVGLPTNTQELRLIDAIISDMAPSFSGNPTIDHLKTNDLCLSVFYFAQTILKPNGTLVCKTLQGSEFPALRKALSQSFKSVYYFKPKSSRSESKEGYFVCKGFKNSGE